MIAVLSNEFEGSVHSDLITYVHVESRYWVRKDGSSMRHIGCLTSCGVWDTRDPAHIAARTCQYCKKRLNPLAPALAQNVKKLELWEGEKKQSRCFEAVTYNIWLDGTYYQQKPHLYCFECLDWTTDTALIAARTCKNCGPLRPDVTGKAQELGTCVDATPGYSFTFESAPRTAPTFLCFDPDSSAPDSIESLLLAHSQRIDATAALPRDWTTMKG